MIQQRRGRNEVELLTQKVLKTDGVLNQNVQIPSFTTTTAFSFHFWFKANANINHGLAHGSNDNNSVAQLQFFISSNVLSIYSMKSGVVLYVFYINITHKTSWQHFAIVINGSNSKFFIDGVQVASSTAYTNQPLTFPTPLTLGAMTGGFASFYKSNAEFARFAWVKKAITTFPTSPIDDDYYSDLTDYQFLIEGNIDRVGATVTPVNSPAFPDIIYP